MTSPPRRMSTRRPRLMSHEKRASTLTGSPIRTLSSRHGGFQTRKNMRERDVVDGGKRNVLGVLIDAVDYDAAVDRVIAAARARRPFAVSALAVHGVMCAVRDPALRYRINALDLVVPDGQPVRWALNLLHGTRLRSQVRGTDLTRALIARAAADGLPVFFYGSRQHVLEALVARVVAEQPALRIAGVQPSGFRAVDQAGVRALGDTLRGSGAAVIFVGLGCPRQERFVFELRETVGIPLIAVGAAFDYIAETLHAPPRWVQRAALEWLWRLGQEPTRLWRRYLTTNPTFLGLLLAQRLRWWRPSAEVALENVESPVAYEV